MCIVCDPDLSDSLERQSWQKYETHHDFVVVGKETEENNVPKHKERKEKRLGDKERVKYNLKQASAL